MGICTVFKRPRRGWLVAPAMLLGLGLVTLMPLVADPRPEPREILVVARDMTFFLEGYDEPNPTIRLAAGEEIRLVLRNEEPGVIHDFVVKSLHVATPPIRGQGTRAIVFRVPQDPGTHQYVCTPHSQMMKGTIRIAD